VNGSPGLLDSLVLATDEVRRCVRFDEDGKPLAWQRCSWADVRATRGFQLVELKDPPLAVNVRVGGKSSPPGKAPGSAPGSALWHGCELDDLNALISSVANDEQVVPLFASNNVKGEGEGESEASAGQKMQG
jgi:hypothetical protein